MGRIIDADSHFMEPLDLWPHYIEPQYRARCVRFETNPETSRYEIVAEGVRITHANDLTIEEVLGVAVGYGQKKQAKGYNRSILPPSLATRSKTWQSANNS